MPDRIITVDLAPIAGFDFDDPDFLTISDPEVVQTEYESSKIVDSTESEFPIKNIEVDTDHNSNGIAQ